MIGLELAWGRIMLAIILSILKIAGMLLLAVLGLLLLALFLVLFVPIRYRAEAEFSGSVCARGTVSWLLHIILLQVSYDKTPEVCIRIFGIRVNRPKASGEKTVRAGKEAVHDGAEAVRDGVEVMTEPAVPAELTVPSEPTAPAEPAVERTAETPPAGTGKRILRFPHPVRKIRVAFRRFCAKLKEIQLKKEAFLEFINKEENRQTFRLIKRQTIRLLKHILPGKMRGTVRFGFDDPYTTGQALAYISPFYGVYARNVQLIPVFEEKTLEGDVRMKGRIRIGTILAMGIRVFFDRNFRTLLKQWRDK